MTANQRRPGFRLPWSSEMDATAGDGASAQSGAEEGTPSPEAPAPSMPTSQASREMASTETPSGETPAAKSAAPEAQSPDMSAAPAVTEAAQPSADGRTPEPIADDFLRDLVAAMRKVADEARDSGVGDLKTKADEQVRRLEADAERRREELRARAEKDVAEVGEWAKAEAERIKQEAESRVVARRAQLETQLSADTTRTEAETKAVRDRVSEYERELDAYHSQLLEINDPAAFAAAAKRMPKPPALTAVASSAAGAATTTSPTPDAAPAPGDPASAEATSGPAAPVEPATTASNGVPNGAPATTVHPAEEEVLAARLAQLDASIAAEAASTESVEPAAAVTSGEPTTTEVVVKGLGSFGAITGFRQTLSSVEGVDGVALSLGQTGEFVFRATHAAGFDLRGAIARLEGDGAKIEDRPEGGLRVTLERAR